MKKLSKLKLNVSPMSDSEMKNVMGGYGSVTGGASGNSGTGTACVVSFDYREQSMCISSMDAAIKLAEGSDEGYGNNDSQGWWCCNCPEAYEVCGRNPI